MKKSSILLIGCLFILSQAYARKDTYYSQQINGNAWNNPNASWLQVQVPQAPFINFLGIMDVLNYKTKSLNSYLKLWLNTENIPTGMAGFTFSVTLIISYVPENPNSTAASAPVTVTKTLTVNYDPVPGNKYKNIAIDNFANAARITVTNISASSSLTTQQKQFISLQTVIEHERYYNYYNIFGNNMHMPILPVPVANYNMPDNELTISWNAEIYAEGYELEYTFIDDYGDNGSGSFITQSQLNFSFQHNSTRILTQQTSYTMPLVFEHGIVAFRVRGYSMAGPGFDRMFFGVYHASVDGNQQFTIQSYPYKFVVAGSNRVHANDKMNWQSVTSFAEEGKSKTVVTYMDGSSRNRQAVTSTSTERNAIVAETIYDFQGRPAVNILPAPVNTPTIKYYDKFNQNMQGQSYMAADFDLLNNSGCGFNINPLKQQNNIGAANYYSQQNSNKQGFNAFIPDANGYPITKVNYIPDPTNRVVQQGNVGEIFQPGNTGINGASTTLKHATKYYYGQPVQQKLDYLFGTDVGYAEFYQKNLVVDPNGQSSVSYIDGKGKTIATALAGNAPPGMDAVTGNNTLPVTINLFSSADVANEAEHSLTSSRSFVVAANATVYNFNYILNENVYNALSCASKSYCLDCIYDLEIKLVNDECGKIEYEYKKTVGNIDALNFLCHDAAASDNLSFAATLSTGSYTISRKLIVNRDAATFYADSIVNDPGNTCIKTFKDFYNEAWSSRDTMRCKEACTACQEEAQLSEEASMIASAVKECDSLWCHPQLPTVCDIARMAMINDLTPGGQYARYMDDNGNITFGNSPVSIFYDGFFPGVNSLMLPASNPLAVLNIQITLPGDPTFPLSHYIRNSNTAPTDTLLKLINNWPEGLSEQLLPLHPEYCYLQFCDQQYVQDGNAFDSRAMNANTFNDAQTEFGTAALADVPTGIDKFYQNDAFWMSLPASLKNQLATKFSNYAGAGNSIKKLAVFLTNCPSGNNINACPGDWGDGINDDDEWEKFKTIYFSLKQEFIQKAREDYVQSQGCCSNQNIGCITNNNCNIPFVWHHTPSLPSNSCVNNNWVVYGNTEKRFVTINDINFPALPNPTTSIYDMTAAQLANYMQSDSAKSVCPTCPELQAIKMLIWNAANKKLLKKDGTIKTNDSSKCTIRFTSDTIINWENAVILPTCVEIKDYRNATLFVIVNGTYKTALNLTSNCDLFYCTGKPPKLHAGNKDYRVDTILNRYIPIANCGNNDLCDASLPSPELPSIPCDSILKDIATQQATEAYNNYRDSLYNAILNGYYAHCMQSIETFTADYQDAEYHYTLYYYDQSGNLVRTVPPQGVKPFSTQAELNTVAARRNSNGASYVPVHFMPTTYRQNSLNAVVWQKTPDAGVTELLYDKLGRIAISQNEKQRSILLPLNKEASYILYDRLGRTVETGVVRNLTPWSSLRTTAFNGNTGTFVNIRPRTEITKTYYDKFYLPKINIAFANGQQNLRNRIGTVAWFASNATLSANNYQHATHYSYDIAGNVKDLLQDFGMASEFGFDLSNIKQQSRHINYKFDLVSGKVNQVNYQPGMADQFFYRYQYNADNKLTHAFTSSNGLIWDNDARYFYYRHGPLARTEYGTDNVQGVDMAYTLQGWIKGANGNAANPGADIGQDGSLNPGVAGIGYQLQNSKTAPDVFGYWLGYNQQDYTAIAGSSSYLASAITSLQTGSYHTSPAELYNGNIRSMYTQLQHLGALGMYYGYDQLNRIKKQDAYNFFTGAMMTNNGYSMQLRYDANGNIEKLLRNGAAGLLALDNLTYYYYNTNYTIYGGSTLPTDPTNKLAYVKDAVGMTINTDDIENQLPYNYLYDPVGNLIYDAQAGLTINWNVQNKITLIKKANGKDIRYNYDAFGNRVTKQVASGIPGIDGSTQYYVRDAQNNVLAVYEMKYDDLHWAEQHLYGSSRLGMYKPDVNIAMISATAPALTTAGTTRNTKQYELVNHLGNVLVTITDSRNIINHATVLTATDYYAFGMAMPGRGFSLNNAEYKYGFNGKENDDEVKGKGNSLDFGARINDPRLGRWLSVDPWSPNYPGQSPYTSMGNNPIHFKDPTGNGTESVHVDKSGKVLRNYNDGDNTVYVHKEGINATDVDKEYVKNEKHSAGGTKIGELGKSIDVNVIFKNMLNEHRAEATDLDHVDWFNKVRGGGEWDLKANNNTIFGVAWAFDEATGSTTKTNFSYKGFAYNRKFNAADVGNYHAGYIGTLMGVPTLAQKVGAGVVERLKLGGVLGMVKGIPEYFFEPYGDQKADFYWNTKGMGDAKSKMCKYTDIYDIGELK